MLEGRCSFLGIWTPPWSSSLPALRGAHQQAVALFVLLPVLGKALRGMVSREGGLSQALLSTGFSGSSCNPLPKFPPSPLGYHHEKKGFRL